MPDARADLLEAVSARGPSRLGIACVALAHNERAIIEEFLTHYRQIGVDHLYIVDDHSTDGTREILCEQPDVSVFSPMAGSTYSRNKRHWRAQLLDTYCDGLWTVVPDIDEHLVYANIESLDLADLTERLDREGSAAMHATMVDMYCDAPLESHRFEYGSLRDTFPLYDGPDHYFRMAAARRFRAEYPTPFFFVFGGMRQRLFAPLPIDDGSMAYRVLRSYCAIDRGFGDSLMDRLMLRFARARLRFALTAVPVYNCSKIPLVKWRRGLWYYNGAHALSQTVPLSRQSAVLLHYKFAGGIESLRYNVHRGQHTQDGGYYKTIIEQQDILRSSPVFEGTRKLDGTGTLGALIGLPRVLD